jgi:hypothetical protein
VLHEGNLEGQLLYCRLRETCKRWLWKRSTSVYSGLYKENLKGVLSQYVYSAGTCTWYILQLCTTSGGL